MFRVIKVNKKEYKGLKYICLDIENEKCNILIDGDEDKKEISDKIEKLLDKIDNIKSVNTVEDITTEKEILLLWPELIERIKAKYPYINGWLERAELKYSQGKLGLKTETKMAYKKINDKRIKNYLEKQLGQLIDMDIEVVVKNGDLLKNLPEVKTRDYKREIINNKIKQNQSNKAADNKNNKIIYGKKINGNENYQLEEVESEVNSLIVKGKIFAVEEINTRRGNTFYVMDITDEKNSLTVKFFPNKSTPLKGELIEGEWVLVKGYVQFDKYSKEFTMIANSINIIDVSEKQDNADKKRVELHLHTQMSAMDAVVEVEKAVKRASKWGHKALAITDHGVVQAFPEAYEAGKKYGVKILYGLEAYMVDDGQPIVFNADNSLIKDNEYTVFDLETTGLKSKRDEIIEIGAVKVKDFKIIDRYNTFIKPKKAIPAKITDLTGIDNHMVADAPHLKEIINDFTDFIGNSVLVAHNALFDYGFLKEALRKTGRDKLNNPILDTVNLSRALLLELKNHKLNTVSKHMNISLENHHRAVDDAEAAAGILLGLFDKMDEGIKLLNDINCLSKEMNWKELPPYHLIILAKNQEGLKQLYKLVSNSHLNHFYRKPRILKSELLHSRDNLLLGSACEAGQLYRSIINNRDWKEIYKIARFYDFLEIQPLANNFFMIGNRVDSKEELKKINRKIYNLASKLKKPVVATGDVHFLDPADKVYRKVLQAGQGYDQAEEQAPLYYRTTEEMLEEFSYLGEKKSREVVIDNPGKIANMTEELKPIPDGLFTPKIDGADEQIKKIAFNKAHELYGDTLPKIVEKRLKKELNSIIDNGYSVIYLISHKLVKKSLKDGYLVGSRGSVGSSFAATMCEITEVNPLSPHYRCNDCKFVEFVDDENVNVGIDLPDKKCPECGSELLKDGYDIPFEVFLGFKGDKVPDIDLNFSGEYQGEIHRYTEEIFGEDYVFRAGTISSIAKRTAFGFVKGFMEDNNLTLRNAEIKRLVQGCTGVRRTTGQHPGGLMVVPRNKDVYDFTPVQHPANDQETDIRTTHFDYHSISGCILKLDLLGHDDPTSLRMLQDLTGVKPEDIKLDDPKTMSLFSSTNALGVSPEKIGTTVGTLGVPEFGTSFVRQMLVDTKPTKFAELVRISGLSHGTDVWLNNAQNLIRSGKAELTEVISVRDDIMNYLIQRDLKPDKAFWIMEHVRKGKGLTDEEEEYMRNKGVPEWYINSCKKIKYMFPKAHAAAYVMMAYRIAYFKVHYPEAFYAAYFTRKGEDFDANLVCKGYEHIVEYKKELEKKGNDLTVKEKNTISILEIVIEAMVRGIKFNRVDLYKSAVRSFKITEDGLLPPLISLEGLGSSAAGKIAATREESQFSSIEDLVNRSSISKTVVEIMKEHGTVDGLPEKNQLSLF